MAILSFQSQVAMGHVGNTAAAFALRLLGHDVWEMPSVLYSNHPGGRAFAGEAVSARLLADQVAALERNGSLTRIDAVMSGYLGSPEQADVVAETVERLRLDGARVPFACDPVFGHAGRGVFVHADIISAVERALVPRADVLLPNQFELEHLTGQTPRTLAGLVEAAAALRRRGPNVVVVTSVVADDLAPGTVGTLACTGAEFWLVETPVLDTEAFGAGDLFAALFVGRYLARPDVPRALSQAVSATFGIIAASGAAPDLALVRAQAEIAKPSRSFAARRL